MFDRVYLKEAAKGRMRVPGQRGSAILVVLVAALLCGNLRLPNFNFDFDLSEIADNAAEGSNFGLWNPPAISSDWSVAGVLPLLLSVVSVATLVGVGYTIFIANIVSAGRNGWFLRYWRGEYPSVGELFATFRIYAPTLATTFLMGLYSFLWSLLFIIPGVVKSYAYSMAPYITYENPNLPANDAITLSRKLTDGAKWELFVFDLSYIGWGILSTFTFGILSIVYVGPYKATAHAGIYESLKARAIAEGRMTWEDFGQVPPAANASYAPYPTQEQNAQYNSLEQYNSYTSAEPQEPQGPDTL